MFEATRLSVRELIAHPAFTLTLCPSEPNTVSLSVCSCCSPSPTRHEVFSSVQLANRAASCDSTVRIAGLCVRAEHSRLPALGLSVRALRAALCALTGRAARAAVHAARAAPRPHARRLPARDRHLRPPTGALPAPPRPSPAPPRRRTSCTVHA